MDREAPGQPEASPHVESGAADTEVAASEVAAAGADTVEAAASEAATSEVAAAGAATVEAAASEVAATEAAASDVAAAKVLGRPATWKGLVSLIPTQALVWASFLVGALFIISLSITFFFGSQAQNAPEGAAVAQELGPVDESPSVTDVPIDSNDGDSFEADVGASDGGVNLGPDPAGVFVEESEVPTEVDEVGSDSVPSGDEPLLAIVIDDWGYAWQAARDFLSFERPLTVAVLPHLPHSGAHANEAHARGHQVILHLPMEPLAEQWDLGAGAVTTVMTSDEIEVDVRAALAAIPHVSGVNNHMGSKATADPRVVSDVLATVKSTGLFFLDSRTTAASVVPEVSREIGVPVLENDRFIDPDTDPQRVKERILLAARLAKRRGYAIAIGHVRPETYAGLMASLEELDQEGVRLAYLWEILERVYPEGAPE